MKTLSGDRCIKYVFVADVKHKVYIDNLGPLGISDSHVIFTFATKSKVKVVAILYCSLFAKFCYYQFIIMCYYQSYASYFVNGAKS